MADTIRFWGEQILFRDDAMVICDEADDCCEPECNPCYDRELPQSVTVETYGFEPFDPPTHCRPENPRGCYDWSTWDPEARCGDLNAQWVLDLVRCEGSGDRSIGYYRLSLTEPLVCDMHGIIGDVELSLTRGGGNTVDAWFSLPGWPFDTLISLDGCDGLLEQEMVSLAGGENPCCDWQDKGKAKIVAFGFR